MKKIFLIINLLLIASTGFSQNLEEELVLIHNVNNTTMLGLSPNEGALAYNTQVGKLYVFDGANWVLTGNVTVNGTTDGEILVWNNTTENWEVGNGLGTATVETKTASYTLTLGDNNKIIEFNSATDVVCTVPTGLPAGYQVSITQLGTGRVEFVGGATVRNAYNSFRTARRYSKAGVEIASTGEAIISGDVAK